jgi:hypothetical protein
MIENGSIESIINLYDTEILAAEGVLNVLKERAQGKSVDRDALTREIKQRFAEIGLVVGVKWFTGGTPGPGGRLVEVPGLMLPVIEINARTQKIGEFDHEQLAHEIQSNILELPGQEKGKISMKEGDAMKIMADKHSHAGHSHG